MHPIIHLTPFIFPSIAQTMHHRKVNRTGFTSEWASHCCQRERKREIERVKRGEKHRQLSITCLSCTHASENRSGHFRSPHVYGSIREGRHHLDRGRPELAATTISVRQQFSIARSTQDRAGLVLCWPCWAVPRDGRLPPGFLAKCIVIAMGNLSVCRSVTWINKVWKKRCWL